MTGLSVFRPGALLRGVALTMALGFPVQGCAQSANTESADAAPAAHAGLDIDTSGGVRHFDVEIALTPEAQARGLMFRKTLAPDAGMIFPFGDNEPRSFWMKNTILPLDMIFIRSTGEIVAIAENTVPFSLKPISPPEPAASVLEVNAGTARRLGIKRGDHAVLPAAATAPPR